MSFGRLDVGKDVYIRAFYELDFSSLDEFHSFISKAKHVKIPRKKKDAILGEYSKGADIEIYEDLLSMQGPFRAGVGEVLTIMGENFGNTQGDILFMNADAPWLGHLTGLNDYYVELWTPEEIRVIVPSRVTETPPGIPDSPPTPAGSGKIRIKRADGVVKESETEISIEYAITNAERLSDPMQPPLPYPMEQVYLAREHCLNGMVFTLHESFLPMEHEDPEAEINPDSHLTQEQSEDAVESVLNALSEWSNFLGITLELEKNSDTPGDYHFTDQEPYVGLYSALGRNNFLATKNRNIIKFQDAVPSAVMLTTIYSIHDQCDDGNPTTPNCYPSSIWHARADIEIVKTPHPDRPWLYDRTANINYAMNTDFYHGILHEIGHALGLAHSIDLDNELHHVMSVPPAIEGVPDGGRMTLAHPNAINARNGATRIANDSRLKVWSSPPQAGNFYDKFGVETLAPFNVNSLVEPTPEISVSNYWSPIDPTAPVPGYLYVKPYHFFNPPPHDNHWLPKNSASSFYDILNICGGRRGTYYVRIKDDACTISSIYSLPYQIPVRDLRICNRAMREDLLSIDKQTLRIYPNPNNGHFDIRFESLAEEETPDIISNTQIGIYDNLGRLQKEQRVSDATLRQTSIDISILPAGIYWVAWFVDGEVIETQQLQKTD